ncbi:unnamed protein product, partial [Allacma fusca]
MVGEGIPGDATNVVLFLHQHLYPDLCDSIKGGNHFKSRGKSCYYTGFNTNKVCRPENVTR